MKFKPDNINPQGRPKVYFCCHPNDFDNYFEVVSNEILEKQKCTIWYAENEDERNDEYFSNLKEMQLFVMPVTTKLLCTENVAIDVEFKFAIENHIPVLPLMQESGLANLFNKKCGDLQFLDKQSTDITAISYNEKLDKYLSSVLIGDELAEKIRAAFDAYVFLSYRKKDRKYAQELMRIIHKNEFCRDIAIWYDEFLIPGENFNDSIIQAIQKSGLFVLTVTPNLVNEKNYVMTEEYPLAQKEGKVIIPAEMVATNRSDLFSCFKNIPECIDARNEDELSKALLKTIKEIAIKENEKTPEHNFFIGLAYLSGIDVEVDFSKALFLINSAAEAGLIEAMRRLVVMYSEGIGTKKDYYLAIKWQERIVLSIDINKDEIYAEYILLGQLNKKVGQYKKAQKAFSIVTSQAPNTRQGLYFVAYAFLELGNIEVETCVSDPEQIKASKVEPGKYDEAERLYAMSILCFENSAHTDEPSSGESVFDIKNIFFHIAQLYYKQKDYNKAKEYLCMIIEKSENLSNTCDKTLCKLFIDTYNLLGCVNLSLSAFDDAISNYEKAYSLSEVWFQKELDGTTFLEYSGIYYHNLAEVCIQKNDIKYAIEYFETAATLRRDISQRNGYYSQWISLANTYDALSKVYEREMNEQEAVKYAELCYDARMKCIKQTDSPRVLGESAEQIFRLIDFAEKGRLNCNVAKMNKKQEERRIKIEKKIRTTEVLFVKNDTEDYIIQLSTFKRMLSTLYDEICDYDTEIIIMLEVIGELEKYYISHKTNALRGKLCNCYMHIAEVYKKMYKMKTCLDYSLKAFDILEDIQGKYEKASQALKDTTYAKEKNNAINDIKFSAESGFVSAIEFLVDSYKTGRYTEKNINIAICWQRKLVEQYYDLYLTYFYSKKNEIKYLMALNDLGDLYAITKDSKNAFNTYKEFYDYFEESGTETNCYKAVDKLKDAYERLANKAKERKDFHKAKEYYELAIGINEKKGNQAKKEDLSTTADWCAELADVCCKIELFDNAEIYFNKAIEIYLSIGYAYQVTVTKLNLGDMYFAQKNYSEAENCYFYALKERKKYFEKAEKPKDDTAISGIAVIYRRLGILNDCLDNFVEAEKYLKATIELYLSMEKPNWYLLNKTYLRLADMFGFMKRFYDAEEYYNQSISFCLNTTESKEKFEPLLADAYDGLASIYRKIGKMDEVENLKKMAISIANCYPDNPDCNFIIKS